MFGGARGRGEGWLVGEEAGRGRRMRLALVAFLGDDRSALSVSGLVGALVWPTMCEPSEKYKRCKCSLHFA